jgi:phosphate transport system substrate-binding protein
LLLGRRFVFKKNVVMRLIGVVSLIVYFLSTDAIEKIIGAGATFPLEVYLEASHSYNVLHPEVSVSYAGLGSGAGLCRIMNSTSKCPITDTSLPRAVDFAGSDSILSSSDYIQFPDLQMYPILVGAVAPIVNIPGINTSSRLVLSVEALAQIFRGSIMFWNDPAIFLTNIPAVQALLPPSRIEIVVRADKSGTTEILKKSLGRIDPIFLSQIGTSSSSTWPGVSTTKIMRSVNIAAYVQQTPYSIGYTDLSLAQAIGLIVPQLMRPTGIVEASATSLGVAAAERGLDFGNNGDPPTYLTADIGGTIGSQSWPLCGYTYLVMRKNTLRPGSTCNTRRQTVLFWEWFLTSDSAKSISRTHLFSPLPQSIVDIVLHKLQDEILCNGVAVYTPRVESTVLIAAPTLFRYVLDEAWVSRYQSLHPEVQIVVQDHIPSGEVGASFQLWSALSHQGSVVTLPFARVSIAVYYNLCDLTLTTYCSSAQVIFDVGTLSNILRGQVTTWNHASIVSTNPWISALYKPIHVHSLPIEDDVMKGLLRAISLDPSELNTTILTVWSTDSEVRRAVYRTGFSLSFTALFGSSVSLFASLAGVTVPVNDSMSWVPTYPTSSIQLKCSSLVTACYPLIIDIDLVTPKLYPSSDLMSVTALVNFMVWTTLQTQADDLYVAYGVSLYSADDARRALARVRSGDNSILMGNVDDHFLNSALVIVGECAASICLLWILILFIWTIRYRRSRIVRSSQPSFMRLLLGGAALMISSIFSMGFDDRNTFNGNYEGENNSQLDIYCMLQVWQYFVGFALALAALLVKTWRIIHIVGNSAIKRRPLTITEVMPFFLSTVLVVILILVCWQVLSPMTWNRRVISYDSAGLPLESTGTCTSPNTLPFISLLLVLQFMGYLIGNYLAFQTKDISGELAESTWLLLTMMSSIQTFFLTLPILYLQRKNPDLLYVGKVMNVLFQTIALTTFIYVPKLVKQYSPPPINPSIHSSYVSRHHSIHPPSTNAKHMSASFIRQALNSDEPEMMIRSVASDKKVLRNNCEIEGQDSGQYLEAHNADGACVEVAEMSPSLSLEELE